MTSCIHLQMDSSASHFCPAPLLIPGCGLSPGCLGDDTTIVCPISTTLMVTLSPISSIKRTVHSPPNFFFPTSFHSLPNFSVFHTELCKVSLTSFSLSSSFPTHVQLSQETLLSFLLFPGLFPFHPILFLVVLCESEDDLIF